MLSWRQRRSPDEEEVTTIRPNQRQILIVVLKWIGTALAVGVLLFFTLFGIDFNPHVSLKAPFASTRPSSGALSSTCFANYVPEESLNQPYGIIPSVPVIEEHTCYEYAALLKSNSTPPLPSVIYHTFWSSRFTSFSDDQVASLRSFIATQSSSATLYLWISAEDHAVLKQSKSWQTISTPHRIDIKIIDSETESLIHDTPLASSWQLHNINEIKHLLRLATLYRYGGVWFDLEVLFLRDMAPLLGQEWLSQAHCLESSYSSTSGSRYEGVFLHFFKGSPYLCEMMTEANAQLTHTSPLHQLPSLGSHLYARIYHRLLEHRMQTWAVLPWCFTDPSQCLAKNSLPSVFRNARFDNNMLSSVFAYHWHKSWTSSPGSIYKFLVSQHKESVAW